MHILIAERDINGRQMLSRILKMKGYQVSTAVSGSHAMSLLRDEKPSMVLMNVFQCMQISGATQAGKITVRHCGEPDPVPLLTCAEDGEKLEEFMSARGPCEGSPFDLLPPRAKSSMTDRILQMCCALRQSSRLSNSEGGFNWQNFITLMERSPSLDI